MGHTRAVTLARMSAARRALEQVAMAVIGGVRSANHLKEPGPGHGSSHLLAVTKLVTAAVVCLVVSVPKQDPNDSRLLDNTFHVRRKRT